MNLMRRNILLAAGLASGLGQLGAQTGKAGAATRKIVLGQSVPLTGAADQMGLAYQIGAKLYFDAFNQRASGVVFEQKVLDDGYDAVRSGANAKQLLAGGADLLFGFFGTACCDAAAVVAQSQNALLFAPFAASNALRTAANNHVFHVRPSLSDEAFKMVRQTTATGQGRIAVLAEDDLMGRESLAAVIAAAEELKLPPILGSVLVPQNTEKVDDAVAKILALQPQTVILASLFTTSAACTRKLRRSSYASAIMNFSVVGLDPLYAALGKDIGGVVVSQVVPSPRSTSVPIVKEYLTLNDKTDSQPTYAALEGFIAAKTLAEAVRLAGKGFDTAGLQKTMQTISDYDIGGFRINLRAGVRDSARTVDLITIASDGKVLR